MTLFMPPRAASVRSDDANYVANLRSFGRYFDVILNGVPVHKVIAYDCDAGWVRRYQVRDGGIVIVEAQVAEETLTGHVSVRWR